MYDVIFVNPVKISDSYSTMPLGTLILATVLHKSNFKVSIVDFNYLWEKKLLEKSESTEENINQMCQYINSLDTKMVGFSTNSSSHHVDIELSRKIKLINPNIKIFLGGHQASLTATETLKQFNWIDLIAIGEGENNIQDVVLALLDEKKLEDVKGIVYRKNDEIFATSEVQLVDNLDLLPMINYDLANMDIDMDRKRFVAFPIEGGRSCPYNCTFCCTKTFWKQKFRIKGSDRLIKEIQEISEKYSVYTFNFLHDLFTLDKKKVIEFCNKVMEKKLNIRWTCSARVDTIDEELIIAMKNAGCIKIFLGVESGSIKLQKSIKKNLDINNIWSKVSILKKHNMKVEAGFMYGFPDETEEDLNLTLNMMLTGAENGYWFPEIGILNVENGTELYDQLKDRMVLSKLSEYTYLTDKNEFEYFYDMISENPTIFPHFYDFISETRQKYMLLDKFMWIFSTLIFLGFKSSIKFVIKAYDNDILKIYIDLIKYDDQIFSEILIKNYAIANGNDYDSVKKRINLLDTLIKKSEYCAKSGEVGIELFNFEKEIVELRYLGELMDKKQLIFNYDVFDIKAHGVNDLNCKVKKCKIKLIKNSKNKIEIQKAV